MFEFAALELGRIAGQIIQEFGSGTKQNRVARENRGMSDVFRDHGLAQAIGTDKDEVAALADEVQREGAVDDVAVDLFGPVPNQNQR